MPEALLGPCMAKFPRAKFVQGYGMTETSPAVCMLPPECHVAGDPRMKSVGRPVPWAEVAVVDPADARDVELPRGTVGEIVTRGPHVMKGWVGDAKHALIVHAFKHMGQRRRVFKGETNTN